MVLIYYIIKDGTRQIVLQLVITKCDNETGIFFRNLGF